MLKTQMKKTLRMVADARKDGLTVDVKGLTDSTLPNLSNELQDAAQLVERIFLRNVFECDYPAAVAPRLAIRWTGRNVERRVP